MLDNRSVQELGKKIVKGNKNKIRNNETIDCLAHEDLGDCKISDKKKMLEI